MDADVTAAREGLARFDLSGRRVMMTGASRGIGRELAKGMASCGAEVFCVARTEEKLQSLVGEIEAAGGSASYRGASLRAAEEIEAQAGPPAGGAAR